MRTDFYAIIDSVRLIRHSHRVGRRFWLSLGRKHPLALEEEEYRWCVFNSVYVMISVFTSPHPPPRSHISLSLPFLNLSPRTYEGISKFPASSS